MSFLPGCFPGTVAAASLLASDGAALASGDSTSVANASLAILSFIDSVEENASSLTAMSGINAGDLLVWYDWTYEGTLVVPSGFTQIGSTLVGDILAVTAYKIASGSEGGVSIAGMSDPSDSIEHKFLLQFRAETIINSIAVQDVAQQLTNDNPTSQTCNASGGSVPLVVIGTYSAIGADIVSPRTFSTTEDAEISIVTDDGFFIASSYVKYKIYNSSPDDTSIDMDDENFSNTLQSFYLEAA